MARLSLVFVAAGFLLLAAATEASTKTIVTTTTTVEENPAGRKGPAQCAQSMEDQQRLSHCSMYLAVTGGRRQPLMDPMCSKEHLQLCCKQLENMGEDCMCEGIMMMLNIQGWRMGEMMNMGLNLPQQCNLMSQPCQLQAV